MLSSATSDDLAAWRRLAARVGPATLGAWLSPPAMRAAVLADTGFAAAMLETLRGDGPAAAAMWRAPSSCRPASARTSSPATAITSLERSS